MSKDHALTHDENRLEICVLCLREQKVMYPLKLKLKLILKAYIRHTEMTTVYPQLYAVRIKEM